MKSGLKLITLDLLSGAGKISSLSAESQVTKPAGADQSTFTADPAVVAGAQGLWLGQAGGHLQPRGLCEMRLHDSMLWHATSCGMQEKANEKLKRDLSSIIKFKGEFPFLPLLQNKTSGDERSFQPAYTELQMPLKTFTVQDFPRQPVRGTSLWDHSSQNSPCCFLQKLLFSLRCL